MDRELSYLRKYGPAFFTVRQLTHITVKEYQSIAAHITEQGVNVNGSVVGLNSQCGGQLTAAVGELLKRVEAEPPKPGSEPEPFDSLLKHCQAVAHRLQSFGGSLDPGQRLELGKAVSEIRVAAARFGVVIWDRR